jgi:hypothetical protein
MNWNRARLTIYIVSTVGLIASLASMAGLGTYDSTTGLFDPHPFNVTAIAGLIAPVVAGFVASVANWFGWGSKDESP